MKLIHRVGYYLGGFVIGLIILFFFLSGKRTSCDYGPDARVLKNIRLKKRAFTPEALQIMSNNNLDSLDISNALQQGDVNFSESDTSKDSCNIYRITFKNESERISFDAENCSKTATISNLEISAE